MIYKKITNENADALLIEGKILGHSKELLPGNELYEISEDTSVDISKRVDRKGVTTVMPDGTDSIRYDIDYFTDGHWWLKDFSKVKEPDSTGAKYVYLFSGIVLLLLGIYMFVNNTGFSGFDAPGRFGGPTRSGSVSAPFTFVFGLVSLGIYISIAFGKRKKNK